MKEKFGVPDGMGAMGFESTALCFQISILLQSHIGLSIKEIGDIDLP